MFEYLMNVFEDQMCVFGYSKIPDIILCLVSSQKLDWTHTFGTYCIRQFGRSFIYSVKRRGPSILPWGMPQVIFLC